jgi:RNA ligase (TIGR02306 family)
VRKLVTIQKIKEIVPIKDADKIELLRFENIGWEVVAEKNLHKVGDLVVYCEIDSWIPHELAPFLTKDKLKEYKGIIGNRLRTVRFKGVLSQGLVFPLSVLKGKKFKNDTRENPIYNFKEGMDVSELLGVIKWEPPEAADTYSEVKGDFPFFIPKTDELRIQAFPNLIEEIKGKEVYITTKLDGTSCTIYYYNNEVGVCGRKFEFKENENNAFWKFVYKKDLIKKLKNLHRNIALQGELMGPKIQGNPLQLTEYNIYFFNVFDIDNHKYLDFKEFLDLIQHLSLTTVPIDYVGMYNDKWNSVNALLELAKGNYIFENRILGVREGIVIRPTIETYSPTLKGRLSFKVVNNDYLLKIK